MARVTVVFEDKPGGTVIQVESDPPLRTCHDPNMNDGRGGPAPDPAHLTPAIASAFGAVMEVAGLAATMELFATDERVI